MPTVAGHILERLRQQGVDTLFGVVGVPCAEFVEAAPGHGLRVVATASDLEAGYAADGYARLRGLSAVSVSYGPGTLSLVNALAGAYLEKSAIVLVSGGPTNTNLANERDRGVLFSHSTGRDSTDFHVVEQVTAATARIANAASAPAEIDRVLRVAINTRRPVYLEVNKEIWGASCPAPAGSLQPQRPPTGQEGAVATQILQRLAAAHHPAVLIGEEVQRYGLQSSTAQLLAQLNLPWASTVLGKAVLAESTAGFAGTYSGSNASAGVSAVIENSDFLLGLGCLFSSGYLSLAVSHQSRMIRAYEGQARIDQGTIVPVELGALIAHLAAGHFSRKGGKGEAPPCDPKNADVGTVADSGLRYDEVFTVLRNYLDGSTLLLADTSLSILPAADLRVTGADAFLAGSAWASIGHSVGAAVGASFASSKRVLVLCGDGGMQMTATALSTLARHGRRCLVLVLDNELYGYEQYLLGPSYFNSATAQPLPFAQLPAWNYPALATALGVPNVAAADSAATLTAALDAARSWPATGLISIKVQSHTRPSLWP